MPTLLIVEVPSNLPIPLISKHTSNVPFWNSHIENYVYGVFSFANKYFYLDDAIDVFHDDDPRVLKEIKSYLEGNRYEIWSKWAVINTLPPMSNELWGKMVRFYLLASQSLVDSKHSLSISHVGNFILVDLTKLATLLVNHVGGFKFQETHPNMVRLGLLLVEDNILYNKTTIDSMHKSSKGIPFKEGQEIHVSTLGALIRACSSNCWHELLHK